MFISRCALRRIPPIAVGRSFCAAFGRKRPAGGRRPLRRGFRQAVDDQLLMEFGVPLPAALDWLVAGACRRGVPSEQLTAFLAELFELEPLGNHSLGSQASRRSNSSS